MPGCDARELLRGETAQSRLDALCQWTAQLALELGLRPALGVVTAQQREDEQAFDCPLLARGGASGVALITKLVLHGSHHPFLICPRISGACGPGNFGPGNFGPGNFGPGNF